MRTYIMKKLLKSLFPWRNTDCFKYHLLKDGTAEIIGYSGRGKKLTVPTTLDGHAVTRIGDRAFYRRSKLISITIPDSVTTIGSMAFFGCLTLTSITIPDSVTTIEYCAFYCCDSLTSVTLPDSVTTIGVNPFQGCSALTDIQVSPDHPTLVTTDGVLFDNTEKKLICYPGGFRDCIYAIPQGTKVIGDNAFSGCLTLTSVTIPDSVTAIGDGVFCNYYALTHITVTPGSYAEQYCIDNGLPYISK